MANNVDHPRHYADTTSLECIEAMTITFGDKAVYDFCRCNAFKYLWRYKNKNGLEDLKKAIWYLNKAREINADDYNGQLKTIGDMVQTHTREYIDAMAFHKEVESNE